MHCASGLQALDSGFLDGGTWIAFPIVRVISERLLEQNSGFQIPAFRIPQATISRIPIFGLPYIRDAATAGLWQFQQSFASLFTNLVCCRYVVIVVADVVVSLFGVYFLSPHGLSCHD